jgi:transposase
MRGSGHMTHYLINHHITGHLVFVLVSRVWVMMCPASCEIHAVIHFLHAENISVAEIHRELCGVYGQNVTSEGTVRQWCRMFKDGWTDVHNEEWSGRPSVVSDDLVQSVEQTMCERWRFTISELLCEFTQTSCTVLCEIITVSLGCHKFCAR